MKPVRDIFTEDDNLTWDIVPVLMLVGVLGIVALPLLEVAVTAEGIGLGISAIISSRGVTKRPHSRGNK